MARNFRRNRTTHPIADLNVTNLIDLGFILLIIFMVASSVMKQEQTVPVELPMESVSAQQKSDPKERSESITVMPDGVFSSGIVHSRSGNWRISSRALRRSRSHRSCTCGWTPSRRPSNSWR